MENIEELVTELLKVTTREDAIAKLEKEIQTLNNDFTIFGYTSEDLKKMKTKKLILEKLKL
jgi:glycine cleavage system regulatory protein